ncbi:putative GTP-binding protein EngB [Bacteroidia bacterium]|nr:putative GTP-binding protein EngB [Bacteroidia bacterium]
MSKFVSQLINYQLSIINYQLSARFVKSSGTPAQCPDGGLPEYAFVGRSNVGKSSLINMLTGNEQLSKVSATPGKTQLINHFLINDEWYLVDLPGYGYAKVGKRLRQSLSKMIWDYLQQRTALTLLFVLIDSRLEPQQNDLEFVQRLGEQGIPFYLIFTKTDKISTTAAQHTVQLWKKILKQSWDELPQMLMSSAAKGLGRAEILDAIALINKTIIHN